MVLAEELLLLLLLLLAPPVVGEVKDIDWFDPSGEKIVPNRQDISVSRSEDASTLVLYKATMDNAGIYTCVASDDQKEAQATVKVTIYRRWSLRRRSWSRPGSLKVCVCVCALPPAEKITFQNAPTPQEFNEGDDADIVCDIISSPPPTIVWKYKGFTIQFSKDGETGSGSGSGAWTLPEGLRSGGC